MGRKKIKRQIAHIILSVFALVAVLIIAVVIINADDLSFESIWNTLTLKKDSRADEFYYSGGSSGVFAEIDGNLAVCSGSEIQLLSKKDGEETYAQIVSMENPAVARGGSAAAFFDVGGTDLSVIDENGLKYKIETENQIVSVGINSKGNTAVCTGESGGYKGLVTVYSASGKAVYQWYSGAGYVLGAAMSKNGDELAVLTYGDEGSRIVFLKTDSKDIKAEYSLKDEVIVSIGYIGSGDGNLALLTDSSFKVINTDGEEKSSYEFGERRICRYALADDFAVLAFGGGYGEQVTIVAVDIKGNEKGTAELSDDIQALSASDDCIAVMSGAGERKVTLYDTSLGITGEFEAEGYDVIACSGEKAIVAGSYAASVIYAYSGGENQNQQ